MRVLLDENLPADLAPLVPNASASTVRAEGWSGITNGELLRRIAGRFDALLTMDQNLQYQQNLKQLPFGVVLIRARSNRMVDLLPLLPAISDALSRVQPGELCFVGA